MNQVQNYLNGTWQPPSTNEFLDILNPATAETIARVQLSDTQDVNAAAESAKAAYDSWRRTPATDRVQYLYKYKALLEENVNDIARIITTECGKTFAESVGEVRRGIENVEVACGIPSLMQGYTNEDIASGIDEIMLRQPVGIVAAITPFNFPAMIPLWFLPYAIACGNCFILKPSERVPLTAVRLIELLHATGLPKGVMQLVHGSKDTVNAILDHPTIRAVSFVGSSAVAKYVYGRATANGKRAQCQGGAKNPVIILPDADVEMTTQIIADSAFGCAGQRCLASSVAIPVGPARETFTEAIADAAMNRKVGSGLDEGVQMGPVISAASKARIEQLISAGEKQGAEVLVDGRNKPVSAYKDGFFLRPTILQNVNPDSELARTEIFGPVLTLLNADTADEAVQIVNRSAYGNMACIFTSSGAAARKFRYEVNTGNVGINVGVAAPMAFFPFSGWNESFFGDLHAQGRHAVEFYTQTKVVVERWPRDWSRKF